MDGSRVLIIFDDGSQDNKVSVKQGVITDITDFSVVLDNKHGIPKHRIYRFEILERAK